MAGSEPTHDLIFSPPRLSEVLRPLVEVIPEEHPLSRHAEAFRRNLAAIYAMASLPYMMGVQMVSSSHYSLQVTVRAFEKGVHRKKSASHREEAAKAVADEVAAEMSSGPLPSDEQVAGIVLPLLSAFPSGPAALLSQSLVATWTAFEVLARDVVATVVNRDHTLARRFLDDEDAKRLLDLKSLRFDVLAEHDFNLAEHMGDLLLLRHPLTSLEALKVVLKTLFGRTSALADALDRRDLWVLSQRRHLIVHRGGVVDAAYSKLLGDGSLVGTRLRVGARELTDALMRVQDVGHVLLQAARDSSRPTT